MRVRVVGGKVLRRASLLCCLAFASVALTGCNDRSAEVVGMWEWGNYLMRFDTDKSWGAIDKAHRDYERMGGSWSISGDTVQINYAGSDAPGAKESDFVLSKDGHQMNAETAAIGTMKKMVTPTSQSDN